MKQIFQFRYPRFALNNFAIRQKNSWIVFCQKPVVSWLNHQIQSFARCTVKATKCAGFLIKQFIQLVVGLNLHGMLFKVLLKIYRISIQPFMKFLLNYFLIISERLDRKFNALQDDFYAKMEDLFSADETENNIMSFQSVNGQQFEYQYEIAWVERTFVFFQLVNFVSIKIFSRIMANIEKARILIDKFHTRKDAHQSFTMPDFEITNPEIFRIDETEKCNKIQENRKIGDLKISKSRITQSLRRNTKAIFYSLPESFGQMLNFNKESGLHVQHQNILLKGRMFNLCKTAINQLIKSKPLNRLLITFAVWKMPFLSITQLITFYRKL